MLLLGRKAGVFLPTPNIELFCKLKQGKVCGESAVSGRKYFPLSDRTVYSYVIEVADSESDFGLHNKALVSEILLFIRIKVTNILLFLRIRLTYIFN